MSKHLCGHLSLYHVALYQYLHIVDQNPIIALVSVATRLVFIPPRSHDIPLRDACFGFQTATALTALGL